jgi:pimeloyl-ACP methyl ester carboxylesterase
MKSRTIAGEIAALGGLIASYPLDWMSQQAEQLLPTAVSEPVILIHGLGGSRANLLGLAAYLRCTGFDNIAYFEYARLQTIIESAAQLRGFARERFGDTGVHLVGHSLGGTIARIHAAAAPGHVRSLITLGSPYSYAQWSPRELAIFGDDDPIVPAPIVAMTAPSSFGRVEILDDTGHLALIYHPEALRIVATELRANRAGDEARAA